MTRRSSITEQIEDVRRGGDALGGLAEHFHRPFVLYARRLIRGSLSRMIGGSDVYSDAFLDAIAALRTHEQPHGNRSAFATLLKQIIKSRIVDEHRRHLSQKRGGGKETSLVPGTDVAARNLTPLEQSIVNDTIARAVVEAELAINEMNDPLHQLAASLSVLEGMSGPDVVDFLQKQFPGEAIPSARTIQRIAANVRQAVTARLRDAEKS